MTKPVAGTGGNEIRLNTRGSSIEVQISEGRGQVRYAILSLSEARLLAYGLLARAEEIAERIVKLKAKSN